MKTPAHTHTHTPSNTGLLHIGPLYRNIFASEAEILSAGRQKSNEKRISEWLKKKDYYIIFAENMAHVMWSRWGGTRWTMTQKNSRTMNKRVKTRPKHNLIAQIKLWRSKKWRAPLFVDIPFRLFSPCLSSAAVFALGPCSPRDFHSGVHFHFSCFVYLTFDYYPVVQFCFIVHSLCSFVRALMSLPHSCLCVLFIGYVRNWRPCLIWCNRPRSP